MRAPEARIKKRVDQESAMTSKLDLVTKAGATYFQPPCASMSPKRQPIRTEAAGRVQRANKAFSLNPALITLWKEESMCTSDIINYFYVLVLNL